MVPKWTVQSEVQLEQVTSPMPSPPRQGDAPAVMMFVTICQEAQNKLVALLGMSPSKSEADVRDLSFRVYWAFFDYGAAVDFANRLRSQTPYKLLSVDVRPYDAFTDLEGADSVDASA